MLNNHLLTALAALALALAIGANGAVFGLVDALALRSLPYQNPDQLVMLWNTSDQFGKTQVSHQQFVAWRDQNQSFSQLAAFTRAGFNLTGGGEPERIEGARVSANLFATLGSLPLLGRTFLPEEERSANYPVVVLSHGLWQRRYRSDPSIIGRTITLDESTWTVVGVMPRGFLLPAKSELWTPLAPAPGEAASLARILSIVARLKPGATIEQAQEEMIGIARRFEQQGPANNSDGVTIETLRDSMLGRFKRSLFVLLGGAALVLFVASLNIANLLLARVLSQSAALGQRRLLSSAFIRSAMVSMIGSAVGLLLAFAGAGWLLSTFPAWLAKDIIGREAPDPITGRMMVFTAAITLLATLIFSFSPILQAHLFDRAGAREPNGKMPGWGALRLLHCTVGVPLVVAEIGAAIVLLACAGLLIKSHSRAQAADLGFNPDNVLTMQIALPRTKYRDDAQVAAFYRQLLERVEALPGMQAAGTVTHPPFSGGRSSGMIAIEGQTQSASDQLPAADFQSVSRNYFRALNIPLVNGRSFTEQDAGQSPLVVVVDETFARRFFPSEEAIGQRLKIGGPEVDRPWRTIVGVVGMIKQQGVWNEPRPMIYFPSEQQIRPSMSLVARTVGDPSRLATAVRGEVRALDANQPVFNFRIMKQSLAESLASSRFSAFLLSMFAALALIQAAIGIYGLASCLAVGTARRGWLILGGAFITLAGVATGYGASLALTRFLTNLLYGVSATDPAVFLTVIALAAGGSLIVWSAAVLIQSLTAGRGVVGARAAASF